MHRIYTATCMHTYFSLLLLSCMGIPRNIIILASLLRVKVILHFQLPNHDITLEAAWPQLFVDKKGTYWEVPASASLDISSLVSASGLRYRFGLHRNSGNPAALNSSSDNVPSSLIPGICAKAAFSYEKSRDMWREREQKSSRERKLEKEPAWLSSYDVRLQEPHAAISGIIGNNATLLLFKYCLLPAKFSLYINN